MKTSPLFCRTIYGFAVICAVLLWIGSPPLLQADETPAVAGQSRLFASPEDATKALLAATKAKDKTAIHEIFGPQVQELLSGDPVQDAAEFTSFAKALAQMCNPVRTGDDRIVLYIGAENWPFPIPLVKKDGQWFFDTAAGKDEVINRRIGGDEITAIGVCHAYVAAQREYASEDRAGDGVLKYAQKMMSTSGKKDGLYWEPAKDEALSPFGPLVAEAREEGYGKNHQKGHPQPFHGYIFKILTAQGAAAPGGQYNYIINGNMIAGFALIAYPAHWGESGIMTFIVNQQGKVYQCNLDENSTELAATITEFNPDSQWTPVQ
ncbi:MAG TPA: DUF2950 domain-containing protein [Opitutaceae bacterium]|jgi:hypothetical protein|nr:DUF2950 domain-containing protein [Opitutaceae bacterium]